MIYLDTRILIYAVEDRTARGDTVRRALAEARQPLVTSVLTAHECYVGPLRERNAELRAHYETLLGRFTLLPLDLAAFTRAAELRAAFGLKTPDALHLAAAQLAGCAELWTNDRRLAEASHGLAVDVLGVRGA